MQFSLTQQSIPPVFMQYYYISKFFVNKENLATISHKSLSQTFFSDRKKLVSLNLKLLLIYFHVLMSHQKEIIIYNSKSTFHMCITVYLVSQFPDASSLPELPQ